MLGRMIACLPGRWSLPAFVFLTHALTVVRFDDAASAWPVHGGGLFYAGAADRPGFSSGGA